MRAAAVVLGLTADEIGDGLLGGEAGAIVREALAALLAREGFELIPSS